jgi:predicted kinase
LPKLVTFQTAPQSHTIIYFIGVPAVGKYTVAKEIGRMTGANVGDNQSINTPMFSVIGYG